MKQYLHPHHVIFTSENPRFPVVNGPSPSIDDVTKFLRSQGENAEIVDGMYDQPERSILVNSPKNVNGLLQMAKDFGQETAIHSQEGKHEMRFLNGPNTGKVIHGQGTKFLKEKPENYYSALHTVDGPLYFQHNFDFNKSENEYPLLEKAPVPFEDWADIEDHPAPYRPRNSQIRKQNPLPNGLTHQVAVDPDDGTVHHFLMHPGLGHLGTLSVFTTENGPTITGSEVHQNYRGYGVGKQLYSAALIHHKKLISDRQVSPEAASVWSNFKNKPGIKFTDAPYSNQEVPAEQGSPEDPFIAEVENPDHIDMSKHFPQLTGSLRTQTKLAASENLQKTPLRYEGYYEPDARGPQDYENNELNHKLKEVQLPNGLLYRQYRRHGSESGERFHALYDNTGTIPLAHLHTMHVEDPMAPNGVWPHAVQWSEVSRDYKGKGLGRQMYLSTLLHGTKQLTSDSRVSQQANDAWKSFKGLPGLGGKIGKYPKPNETLMNPSLVDSYEADRHQVFVRDPKQVNHKAMFPDVNLHDEEKLASSEKHVSLDYLKSILETQDEPETLDIPEHLQIQWATPVGRWIK